MNLKWIETFYCNEITVPPSDFSHFCNNQELDSFCNPIIYKPKPKVEPPSDGQSKANGEHNGPVNGESGTETRPDPAKDNSQQTKPSGEMEVD